MEVEEQYKDFALPSGELGLFWARFEQSKWALIGTVGTYGGQRLWKVHNLLVTFHDDNTVNEVVTLSDHDLFCQCKSLPPVLSPLDLSHPLKVGGMTSEYGAENPSIPVDLTLSATGLSVTTQRLLGRKGNLDQPRETFDIPNGEVRKVTFSPTLVDSDQFKSEISVQLYFSKKTSHFGKGIAFNAEPRVALTLLRWVTQVKESSGTNRKMK